MSNTFPNFNNVYGSLAQSAYPDMPLRLPLDKLSPKNQTKIKSGQSVSFDYSVPVEFDGRIIPGGHFKREPNADPNVPQEGLVYL